MEETKEIKQQLDIIVNKVVTIVNYTEKETVSLNANAMSDVIPTIHTNPDKIESRSEEINNRVEYINRAVNLLEKPTNPSQLKCLSKVIQIESDQL